MGGISVLYAFYVSTFTFMLNDMFMSCKLYTGTPYYIVCTCKMRYLYIINYILHIYIYIVWTCQIKCLYVLC